MRNVVDWQEIAVDDAERRARFVAVLACGHHGFRRMTLADIRRAGWERKRLPYPMVRPFAPTDGLGAYRIGEWQLKWVIDHDRETRQHCPSCIDDPGDADVTELELPPAWRREPVICGHCMLHVPTLSWWCSSCSRLFCTPHCLHSHAGCLPETPPLEASFRRRSGPQKS